VKLVDKDGQLWVIDGINRLDAQAQILGLEVVDADGKLLVPHEVLDLPDDRAIAAYVCSMTVHRRHLKPDEKRDAIRALVLKDPEKSDRYVAKQVGVSPTTVGKARRELEASGAVSSVDTATDKHGRKQSRKKKPAANANLTVATMAQNAASALPKDFPGELRTQGAGELKRAPNTKSNDKSSSETAPPTAASNGIPTQNAIVAAWRAATDQPKTAFLKKCAAEFSYYGSPHQSTKRMRPKAELQAILGPATAAVHSGGEWADPETGEVQSEVHLHWRLDVPAVGLGLDKFKTARRVANAVVGGDTTNDPVSHPLRWPGSWHRRADPRLYKITRTPRRDRKAAEGP
jgi:hypothetical protein